MTFNQVSVTSADVGDLDEQTGGQSIERIVSLVNSSDLSVTLVEIDTMQRLATSGSIRALFGVDASGPVITNACRDNIRRLHLEPRVNGVHYRQSFHDVEGNVHERQFVVERVPGTANLALLMMSRAPGAFPAKLSSSFSIPTSVDGVAFGTISHDFRIERVTAEIQPLLGLEASEVTGKLFFELFDDSAVPLLMMSLGWALDAGQPVMISTQVITYDGSTAPIDVVFLPVQNGNGRAESLFLLRESQRPGLVESNAKASVLEQHLLRIAQELEAAGIAAKLGQVSSLMTPPEVGKLSSRQIEVLTRLLSGERVAGIARDMFISPSTVRNHLSAIFAKFGVHSQSELVDRLHQPEGQLKG